MGNAFVAGGVLGDVVSLVVAGSLALLGALVGFAVGAGPASSNARGRLILYRVAILGLGVSVVIGSVLAT